MPEVLHYTGYASGHGGIMAAVRVLAAEKRFATRLGVHPDYPAAGEAWPLVRLPAAPVESAGPAAWLAARRVARAVREWLAAKPDRIFHGHSRAGLLVTLWLQAMGVRRAVATVHVLGRQRWLYRAAARRLGNRVCWLGPAMKRHYGLSPEDWSDCLPDAVPRTAVREAPKEPRGPGLTLGAVGALAPVKQWETLLRAVGQGGPTPGWRVIHAGVEDGTPASRDYATRLQALHQTLGLGPRWQFRGQVRDMATFYDEIDCLVVCSPREASSMAALEAIAAGVPVLAPACSGTSDLINVTAGGWLFGDERDLVRQLRAMASESRLVNWRRDAAGLERFMADRVAEQHAQYYREFLA